MEDTNMMEIVSQDGNIIKVNVITCLNSDDNIRQYIVYTKNESPENMENEKIIYVSKLHNKNNILSISEINDDVEWNEVQKLLRKIANTIEK